MENYIMLSLKRCDNKIKFCRIITIIFIIASIALGCVLKMGVVLIAIPIILFVCNKKLNVYSKVRNTLLLTLVDNKQQY